MKNISRSVVPAVALFFLGVSCSKESSAPISFGGSSKELKATEVLGTLDTPVPQDKNAIWCASFQAAWKALEQDLAGEPVELEGSPGVAKLLNDAPDPRPQM